MMNIQKIALILILGLTTISCGKKEKQVDDGITTKDVVVSETVPAEVFLKKLNETSNAVLLDVRTPEEFREGYIEGSTNIDYRASDFQSKVSTLDKNATYFVYCASGRRSRSAADLMKELDFKNVYELKDGFKGWSKKGLPAVIPQN
ncbi:MAG TPA: rhodanese-like domain-containing protein [Cyclobacteriaceae bacterium]|jgi:rhodanese-related sulfurtransferase|nr:rhodanese-like domain-containing protein [Cyclobacteriaceae bacterium]